MSHTCISQAAPGAVIVSSTKNEKSAINDNHLYTEQWRKSHVMLQWFINRNVSFSDKWHANTSQCSQTNTNAVQSNVKCKPLACDGQTFLCRNIFPDTRNKNTLITSLNPVSVAALQDGAALSMIGPVILVSGTPRRKQPLWKTVLNENKDFSECGKCPAAKIWPVACLMMSICVMPHSSTEMVFKCV